MENERKSLKTFIVKEKKLKLGKNDEGGSEEEKKMWKKKIDNNQYSFFYFYFLLWTKLIKNKLLN